MLVDDFVSSHVLLAVEEGTHRTNNEGGHLHEKCVERDQDQEL